MTDLIIADSTCLIGLERIDKIDLLPQMYSQVIIPPQVQKEFGLSFAWLIVKNQRVKPEFLLNMEILIPNSLIVDAFSKITKPLYSNTLHDLEQSRTLTNIRDTLLPKLMSGDIRVKEAETMIEEAV